MISVTGGYFYLRQTLPLILYVLYRQLKEANTQIIDTFMTTGLVIIGVLFSYTFTGLMLQIPFTSIIPFQWHYQGVLTWTLFFIAYYRISLQSDPNKLKSFTLATLAAVGGGWLYEIPFFHPPAMFISQFAVYKINGQIICLLLLAYELKKTGFKPNKLIYATLALFIGYSTYLFYNISLLNNISVLRYPATWFMRIPACLFLISLLGGIKNG